MRIRRWLGVVLLAALPAQAGVPDWLRAAAAGPVPAHSEDADAVILLDERETVVKSSGEIKTRFRRAVKILRPVGRSQGTVAVDFDNDTRLTYLKGWCLPAQGEAFEVKEKDAVETSYLEDSFFSDTRHKVLVIPAAEPGNIIGYEYEQKNRPNILEMEWSFQHRDSAVGSSRFVLEVPTGWEYQTFWRNYPAQEGQAAGENRWSYEVKNIPPVEPEPEMPNYRAVRGHAVFVLYPPAERLAERRGRSWRELGQFQAQLADGRSESTPEMRTKVAQLTAGATTLLEKMRRLSEFAQRDIRYVAIEIGIGGLQPHTAADVFSNRYGDCKDKANLLKAMLREIGVESYFLSINNWRGGVDADSPPALRFNHRILAIQSPAEVESAGLHSMVTHPTLGRLLLFDPTDEMTPLGYLPDSLQASYGLLFGAGVGELIATPLLPPPTNRLLRTAKLTLTSAGLLVGDAQEIRWGLPAREKRGEIKDASEADRRKAMERFLAGFLARFSLQSLEVEGLDRIDDSLVLRYRFMAPNYAKAAGDLLLVRPRVLGAKGTDLLERVEKGKQRRYPIDLEYASLQSDVVEIQLPAGYRVDEVPPGVEAENEYAAYRSKVEVEGSLLRYQRDYTVKQVLVPTERLAEMKKFFRQIAADERASVVLKKAP